MEEHIQEDRQVEQSAHTRAVQPPPTNLGTEGRFPRNHSWKQNGNTPLSVGTGQAQVRHLLCSLHIAQSVLRETRFSNMTLKYKSWLPCLVCQRGWLQLRLSGLLHQPQQSSRGSRLPSYQEENIDQPDYLSLYARHSPFDSSE